MGFIDQLSQKDMDTIKKIVLIANISRFVIIKKGNLIAKLKINMTIEVMFQVKRKMQNAQEL